MPLCAQSSHLRSSALQQTDSREPTAAQWRRRGIGRIGHKSLTRRHGDVVYRAGLQSTCQPTDASLFVHSCAVTGGAPHSISALVPWLAFGLAAAVASTPSDSHPQS
ncbi:hypothetical protein CSOJ01_00508 [Colletotrichum sojae]|uniref:Uncharacterized protein n=1 Tax=Colletotrichum sojae TaxID=2175907 RepID=A0A8H6N660_9PEZI|nr:hypothetical protein CSOJ01_00508 [Colletotrichum sojae]